MVGSWALVTCSWMEDGEDDIFGLAAQDGFVLAIQRFDDQQQMTD